MGTTRGVPCRDAGAASSFFSSSVSLSCSVSDSPFLSRAGGGRAAWINYDAMIDVKNNHISNMVSDGEYNDKQWPITKVQYCHIH